MSAKATSLLLAGDLPDEVANRKEELAIMHQNITGHQVVALTGHRNSGKTSTMAKLVQQGEESGRLFATVMNLRSLSSGSDHDARAFAVAFYKNTQTSLQAALPYVEAAVKEAGKAGVTAAEKAAASLMEPAAWSKEGAASLKSVIESFKMSKDLASMSPAAIVKEALQRVST